MTNTTVAAGRAILLAAFAALAALASLIGGCSKASRDLQPGAYRATVTLPGDREVPFGLDVAQEEQGTAVFLVNGDERSRLTDLHAEPGKLSASVAGGGTVTADVTGGELRGSFTIATPRGRKVTLPFRAELGKTHRFFEQPLTDNADFAGRWSIAFTDDRGGTTRGVAEMKQKFASVTAEVRLPGGGRLLLAGEAHDEELRLSRCDGAVALLYHGRLDATGALAGEAWSGSGEHLRFRAQRDANAVLADPAAGTDDQPAAAFTQ